MTRILLHTQLGLFLCYGIISGAAISYVIHSKCREAEANAIAAVLIQLSPRALSEVRI